MTPPKRFTKTLNCCIPGHIKAHIEEVARAERRTPSEAVRELLEIGLQSKGIEVL